MKMTTSLVPKTKKNQNIQNMVLISVNVVGSTGPIRLIVKKDDVVSDVVSSVLKVYARQGRVPVLGFEAKDFELLCLDYEIGDLDLGTKIGKFDNARSFMLWKKTDVKKSDCVDDGRCKKGGVIVRGKVAGKGSGAWKTWLRKSFKIAVSSH